MEGLVYSPTTPEGLCRFETPQTLSNEFASETINAMELLERTAAEASIAFCVSS